MNDKLNNLSSKFEEIVDYIKNNKSIEIKYAEYKSVGEELIKKIIKENEKEQPQDKKKEIY
jgi:hypothetical protein